MSGALCEKVSGIEVGRVAYRVCMLEGLTEGLHRYRMSVSQSMRRVLARLCVSRIHDFNGQLKASPVDLKCPETPARLHVQSCS